MNETFVGTALADHWDRLGPSLPELRKLYEIIQDIDSASCDLPWLDWISLSAAVLGFKPDLIIELGRGYGNSTALFGYWGVPVVSVCQTDYWSQTHPKLVEVFGGDRWNLITAIVGDINTQDYRAQLGAEQRIMLFWDAHGYAIADTVLSRILPLLNGRNVFVACHDMRDNRYSNDLGYGDYPIWVRQEPECLPFLHLGTVYSSFEQVVNIVDFCSRNRLSFHSATHALAQVPQACDALAAEEGWPYCYWHYFCPSGTDMTYPTARSRPMRD